MGEAQEGGFMGKLRGMFGGKKDQLQPIPQEQQNRPLTEGELFPGEGIEIAAQKEKEASEASETASKDEILEGLRKSRFGDARTSAFGRAPYGALTAGGGTSAEAANTDLNVVSRKYHREYADAITKNEAGGVGISSAGRDPELDTEYLKNVQEGWEAKRSSAGKGKFGAGAEHREGLYEGIDDTGKGRSSAARASSPTDRVGVGGPTGRG